VTFVCDDSAARAEVMRLHYLEGLSIRAISRRQRMSRKKVRQHLGVLPEPRKVPSPPRASILDAYDGVIRQLLADVPELRATQILERLRQQGYSGGVSILRDRVRKLRPKPTPKAFLTSEYVPGQVMQVDWADFGFVLPGVPRRVSAFVATLAYSRYLYIEFTLSQTMGSFLRCMDRAVASFGGTTTADVFDNMKTVVLEHRAGSPARFNPRFLAYANARGGFAVVACTPHHPQSKGGVERSIRFVRERFWPGRRFADLLDLNVQAAQWRDSFANGREHDVTGKVPALVFEHEEKATLRPLGAQPFDTDDFDSDTITHTFRTRFDRNTYSVPWRLVGQHVLLRASDDVVRIFLGPKCVAEHRRSWQTGADVEDRAHRRELIEFRRSDPVDLARERLGDIGERYFKTLATGTRSMRRESARLTFLAELFGSHETRSAMQEVMHSGHVGVEYVEFVLRHKRNLKPAFTPLRLGNVALDGIMLREPDMSIYDPPVQTRDPDESSRPDSTVGVEENDREG